MSEEAMPKSELQVKSEAFFQMSAQYGERVYLIELLQGEANQAKQQMHALKQEIDRLRAAPVASLELKPEEVPNSTGS